MKHALTDIQNIRNDFTGSISIPLLKKIRMYDAHNLVSAISKGNSKSTPQYKDMYNFIKTELFKASSPLPELKDANDKNAYINAISLFAINAFKYNNEDLNNYLVEIDSKNRASELTEFLEYLIKFSNSSGAYSSFDVDTKIIWTNTTENLKKLINFIDTGCLYHININCNISVARANNFIISYYSKFVNNSQSYHTLHNQSDLSGKSYSKSRLYFDVDYIYFTEYVKLNFDDSTRLSSKKDIVAHLAILDLLNTLVSILCNDGCMLLHSVKFNSESTTIYKNNYVDTKYMLMRLSSLMDIFKISVNTDTLNRSLNLSSESKYFKITNRKSS